MSSSLIRFSLDAFAVAAINIGSILAGLGVYQLVRPVHQMSVQLPVAAALSIAGVLAWLVAVPRFRGGSAARGAAEWIAIYGAVFVAAAIIFVPLHFVARGYLTSRGNLLGLWAFQAGANLPAVLAGQALGERPRSTAPN